MSGIHTHQKLAILDASSGISLNCFKSYEEMVSAIAYRMRARIETDNAAVARFLRTLADEVEAEADSDWIPEDAE